MLKQEYIICLFLIILIMNFSIFIFLLINKIVKKIINKKKDLLYKKYSQEIEDYIISDNKNKLDKPSTSFKKKVFENVIIDYLKFIDGDTKNMLLGFIDQKRLIKKTKNNIKSCNSWKQKIGVYNAGKFKIKEAIPKLTELLKTKDRELFYILSKALIQIGGDKYLVDILNEASKRDIINRNNLLALIEDIDTNIECILENMMEQDNVYLNIIALELIGKRRYYEGIKWIKKMILHPLKQVRISALKGAIELGDVDDSEYINRILNLNNDHEWEVRAFLAKFLQNIKSDESINLLKELMKDTNWYVRHNSAESLINQGNEGIRVLLDLLYSEDDFSRDKSREILQKEIYFNKLLQRVPEGDIKEKLIIETHQMQLAEGVNTV